MTRILLPALHLASLLTAGAVLAHALATTSKGQAILAGLAHPILDLGFFLALIAAGLWAGRLGGPALAGLPLGFLAGTALGIDLAAGPAATDPGPLLAAAAPASTLVLALAALRPPHLRLASLTSLFAAAGACHGSAASAPSLADPLAWAGLLVSAAALLGLGAATGRAGASARRDRPD